MGRDLTLVFLVAASLAALAVWPLQLPTLSKPLLVFIGYFLAIVAFDVMQGGRPVLSVPLQSHPAVLTLLNRPLEDRSELRLGAGGQLDEVHRIWPLVLNRQLCAVRRH
jgi:hypothetical protein